MTTSSECDVAGFYDKLAADYDAMTGFTKRLGQEESTFRSLVQRFSIRKAVDAGCGTGFHSVLLAKLGVEVIGVDVSGEMLARASGHAREMNVAATFLESTFQEIGKRIANPVDAVFCLGNSLAHLLSTSELLDSLRGFAAVLRTGGTLFVQVLNYDRIMSHRKRVQSVKEEGNTLFVRFYDFEPDGVRFNILKLQRSGTGFQHEMNSVRLRPVLRGELSQLLSMAGFKDVKTYANAKLEAFDKDQSTDLFVVAVK